MTWLSRAALSNPALSLEQGSTAAFRKWLARTPLPARYFPVPTIRRDLKARPAITKSSGMGNLKKILDPQRLADKPEAEPGARCRAHDPVNTSPCAIHELQTISGKISGRAAAGAGSSRRRCRTNSY